MLTAEELLAGSEVTFAVEVPESVLRPEGAPHNGTEIGEVRLRPLTVRDLQLISRAAKESDQLTATLMVQRSLVEPALTAAQVAAMPAGLVQFLLHHVERTSGLAATAAELASAGEAPLAQVAHALARDFGWTPQQLAEMTIGQALLYLKMQGGRPG
jgi:hypothetical protein